MDLDDTIIVTSFTYNVPGFAPIVWNITEARRAAEAGEIVQLVQMDLGDLQSVVERNAAGIDWSKVETVDRRIPGIAAPIINHHTGAINYVLIDGNHRAAQALAVREPFMVRLLTGPASRRAIISGPPALIP
jgi:hypothetical protein